MPKLKSRSMIERTAPPKAPPIDYDALEQKRRELAFKAAERGLAFIRMHYKEDGVNRIHKHVWVNSTTDCPLALASGSGDYAKTALEYGLSEHRAGQLGFISSDHYTMFDLSCAWQHFARKWNPA